MALPTKFKHSLAVEDAAILVLEAMEGKVGCSSACGDAYSVRGDC